MNNPLATRFGLAAILLAAFALRACNLEQQGWGADYYSAAVLSMSQSWHNFFFVAFDPAGFISVDKPPLALWLQVAVVKLFGFSPIALLLPQAIIGTICVWLIYRLARHSFGEGVGLLAAALMAITPVMVAVNRTNNLDSTLLLCLLLSAGALLRATELGSRRWLMVAMVGLGLAFNVKMLAGVLVLPVFVLVYGLMANRAFGARLADLALASLALLLVALSWVSIVQFTPAESRPYIGSSRDNSMAELVLGHNARSRLYSPRVATAGASDAPTDRSAPDEGRERVVPVAGQDLRSSIRELAYRLFVRNPTGPTRLLYGMPAAQMAWLLPLLLFGAFAGLTRRSSDRRAAPERSRVARIGVVFWLLWLGLYTLVYSLLGGIIHFYYLSTLAPALAVLAALSLAALWSAGAANRGLNRAVVVLPFTMLLWQAHLQSSAMGWSSMADFFSQREVWLNAVHLALAFVAVASALLLLLANWREGRAALRLRGLAFAGCFSSALLLPTVWSLSSVRAAEPGIVPSADLYRWQVALREPAAFAFMRYGQGIDTTRLVEYLKRERAGEVFLVATSSAQWAAPVIIATGQAVMARGGYHGTDAATSPARLQALVNARQLRFILIDDVATVSRRLGASAAGQEIADWVRANGRRIEPAQWRSASNRGTMELFDLRQP